MKFFKFLLVASLLSTAACNQSLFAIQAKNLSPENSGQSMAQEAAAQADDGASVDNSEKVDGDEVLSAQDFLQSVLNNDSVVLEADSRVVDCNKDLESYEEMLASFEKKHDDVFLQNEFSAEAEDKANLQYQVVKASIEICHAKIKKTELQGELDSLEQTGLPLDDNDQQSGNSFLRLADLKDQIQEADGLNIYNGQKVEVVYAAE